MKKWKGGVADEGWKVSICERDIRAVRNALLTIEDVIGGPIDALTGTEIRAALKAYADNACRSIEKGNQTLSLRSQADMKMAFG